MRVWHCEVFLYHVLLKLDARTTLQPQRFGVKNLSTRIRKRRLRRPCLLVCKSFVFVMKQIVQLSKERQNQMCVQSRESEFEIVGQAALSALSRVFELNVICPLRMQTGVS